MMKANKRAISGVVLLDKPLGLSSNQVLQRVKHLFSAEKAGHTGSLDPLATGMLPICLGEATKFSQYLLDADKCYTVTAQLGVKTSTADREGEIIATAAVPSLTPAQLQPYLQAFLGKQTQIPSMYSALKHQGKPLYQLARQGIEVERAPRQITIHALTLLSCELPLIQLRVVCSKGTYIRNLMEDLGEKLGCHAHVTQLHRDWVQGFEDKSMVSMEILQVISEQERDAYLLPFEVLLNGIEYQLHLDSEAITLLYHGKRLPAPNDIPDEVPIRIYSETQCIGLAQIREGQLCVLRLMAKW